MEYPKEDVDSAVKYAESVKITVEVSPDDEQSFVFNLDPPIPESINEEVRELVELCLNFYQRIVFTGGYEVDEPKPADKTADNVLDDVNISLEHYKGFFIYEVQKALGLIEPEKVVRPIEDEEEIKPKVSRYAEAMMGHRTQLRNKKKKS
jgi:hypothetical protein